MKNKHKFFYLAVGCFSTLLITALFAMILKKHEKSRLITTKNIKEFVLEDTYFTNALRMDSITLKHLFSKDTVKMNVANKYSVIVSQFSTRCRPCLKEMKSFVDLNRKVKHLKLFFVSKEGDAILEKFIKKYPDFKEAVYRDINSSLNYPQLPNSYLYTNGKLSYFHDKSSNWNNKMNVDFLNSIYPNK